MIDLIYDCDITMGLPGSDVDDGLALLFLLGSPQIQILGITTTFGNSTIEEVHPCLLSVLNDLGSGFLRTESRVGDPADGGNNSWRINLPKQILDMAGYWRTLFDGWRRAGEAWPQ